MDGLVLDSEVGYFAAWQLAAEAMGYRLSRDFCESLSGTHGSVISQGLVAHLGTDFDIDNFYRLSSQFWREQIELHGIPVKCGFHRLLRRIRELGLPYALATNSRRADTVYCLDRAGLSEVFSVIISRDEVANPKPAADVFVKTAEALQVKQQHCLVLEDSPIGVAAANAASCSCIFVPSCSPPDAQASQLADFVMRDLAEVADFISAAFYHPL